MIAILSPGQGSQKEGMLETWLEEEALISNFQSAAGIDIVNLGTNSSSSELKKTFNAQVLISLVTAISFKKILEHSSLKKDNFIFAGHSVGEVSSYYFSGILDFNDYIFTLISRARSMEKACDSNIKTGMLAIIGSSEQIVKPLLNSFDLKISNINSSTQIILSGLQKDLLFFKQKYRDTYKMIELDVAGGFHSEYMSDAQTQFQNELRLIDFKKPKYNVISNRDGKLINDGTTAKNYLIEQITKPVRWDLCLDTLRQMNIKAVLELAPGGVLAGIAKKELNGIKVFAIKNSDDIKLAIEFLLENAA